MELFRREVDVTSGEEVLIAQAAYRDSSGGTVVIDKSEAPPFGFERFDPSKEPSGILVTSTVTRRQGRLQLLRIGKLEDVESAIDGIEDQFEKFEARVEYENSTWHRSSPWLEKIGAMVGIDNKGIDLLFAEASRL